MKKQHTLYLLLIISWVILATDTWAQHLNYALFQHTPMLVNPALQPSQTDWSVSTLFRSQAMGEGVRATGPTLSAIRMFRDRTGTRQVAGIGGTIINEQSGPGNSLNNIGMLANYNYLVYFGDGYYLSLGIQAGAYNRRINLGQLRTEMQFTGGGFDPTLDNGENAQFESRIFPTMGLGATWHYQKPRGYGHAWLGIAGFNINEPDWSLTALSDPLAPRMVVNGGFSFAMHSEISLTPLVQLAHQAGSNRLLAGAVMQYHYENFTGGFGHFGGGLLVSPGNSLAFTMEFARNSMGFVGSVEIPFASRVQTIQSFNAFEVGINWRPFMDKSPFFH